MTANIVLLDNLLAQYGPEADAARNLMRRGVAILADRKWRENSSSFAFDVRHNIGVSEAPAAVVLPSVLNLRSAFVAAAACESPVGGCRLILSRNRWNTT